MITASQQIDRVANSLTRLAKSRLISDREIKSLVLRLDRIANTLDKRSHGKSADPGGFNPNKVVKDALDTAKTLVFRGVTPEEVSVDYLMENFALSRSDAFNMLDDVKQSMKRWKSRQEPQGVS